MEGKSSLQARFLHTPKESGRFVSFVWEKRMEEEKKNGGAVLNSTVCKLKAVTALWQKCIEI